MSKTKKGFLIAGAIITLLSCVVMLLSSKIFDMAKDFINEDFIIKSYEEEGYQKITNPDGSYVLQLEDEITYEKTNVTEDEVQLIIKGSYVVIDTVKFSLLAFSVISGILAVCILVQTSKEKSKKGTIVALLVISALTFNYITMAFMIVALCIKNKPKVVIESNDDIVLQ